MMEFTFEESAWEQALKGLDAGDTLSGAKALALMEEMSDEEAEEALLALEEQGITLDITDLPMDYSSGEAALRLRQEQQMVLDTEIIQKQHSLQEVSLRLQDLV